MPDDYSTTLEAAHSSPASSADAAACVLHQTLADPTLTTAAALELHRQRVAALRDPTAPEALDELARQVPLLEALFQRFAVEALRARLPAARAQLLRAALQAQQAHARTFALLRGLALQDKGRAVVTFDDDPDDDRGEHHANGS